MSAPAYVVFPVEGDAGQISEQENIQGAKIVSAIQRSINEEIHPQHQQARLAEQQAQTHHEEHNGPLKAMLDNRQSFYYKYISWDDPLRTLCSYLGVLSILIVGHYMPFTHLALKAGAITLGVTAAMEFASRAFGPDTFLARLRPKPYKTIPEDTLNATLKDIHDFIQFSVREAQKIVFAQELDKTLLTAVALGTILFLSNVLSPFAFSVLALTTVYIGALAASSVPSEHARVKDVARRAMDSAGSKAAHPAPEFPVTLKEEASQPQQRNEPAGQQQRQYDVTTGAQHTESGGQQQHHQDETATGTQQQHQRRAFGQELRETNIGHRRVGSADGGSPASPTKSFSSSIPVVTTLNAGHRHPGSNW